MCCLIFYLRTLFPGVEDSFEWFWEQRLWTPTQVWQGSGVLAWVTHCMNHVLYCCGHSGFDSWATIYPCPKEVFMHKCWEAVKASERSRLARAQIGLRWAKFLVLSESLYIIIIIGLFCFSQRVQQIRTQRLTSAFGVINLPHLFHSIPVVVVNFFVHFCYIYEFGWWFYTKSLAFKVKQNFFMGSLGIKPMICIVSWDQIWNSTIVPFSILFLHILDCK